MAGRRAPVAVSRGCAYDMKGDKAKAAMDFDQAKKLGSMAWNLN